MYLYGNGGLYEIAAAYTFYIAESQACFDGNKRTGMQAAVDFLEINGVDTIPLPELGLRPRDSVPYRNRLLTRAAPVGAATVRERCMAAAQYHTVGELAAYEAMIHIARHELDRSGLAVLFRGVLKPNA